MDTFGCPTLHFKALLPSQKQRCIDKWPLACSDLLNLNVINTHRITISGKEINELPPCRWRATRWGHYRAVRGERHSCVSRGNRCHARAPTSATWRAAGRRGSRARTRRAAKWWARRRRRRTAATRSAARPARAPPCRCRANVLTGTRRAPMLPGAHIPARLARTPTPTPAVRLPCFA